ncbi:MAG: hypothetical protein CMH62_00435 [Nanoarchaeota archaeon]|nr:hypothetical protein [Nanoarchaeota archaeon]|tara:strand:+ start:929 stop:1141 length:213 start_codon:yes stop_codon:yes gene_type:complete
MPYVRRFTEQRDANNQRGVAAVVIEAFESGVDLVGRIGKLEAVGSVIGLELAGYNTASKYLSDLILAEIS